MREFEPGLFEPESPFPGNGILQAETKATKRQLGINGLPQRQSVATQLRQSAAIWSKPGNLRLHESAWWRTQSVSNRSLQQNSLLTGKIAKLDLPKQPERHLVQQPWGFLAKFPVKTNKE
jgi:hypothetical protein